MEPIAYTVRAEFPDRETLERFAAWIEGGHAADVIRGGASTATLEQPDPPTDAPANHVLEIRYVFPSRGDFVRYEREHAPSLREEGLVAFPPSSGVRMTRRLASIRWSGEPGSTDRTSA